MIITDSVDGGEHLTVDGVSEFMCDGLVVMYNQLIGARRSRTLSILKMRNTDHSQYVHDLEFGKIGMSVKPAEQVYK